MVAIRAVPEGGPVPDKSRQSPSFAGESMLQRCQSFKRGVRQRTLLDRGERILERKRPFGPTAWVA